MPDWTDIVSACVGVAGLAYGLSERYIGKRTIRIDKINEVLRDREDKVLFSQSVPDVALRPLAASAKEWREKCSEARAITSQGSPARRDLKICLDAAAIFENRVEQMLQEKKEQIDDYMFVDGHDKERLDELKAQLRDATREPAEHLASRHHWWDL
jgi:hypothetical protein